MAKDDWGIDNLAVYLHLRPQQVAKLAGRGKLPGRKVAGQWRFSRAEIHHWLERQIGLSDEMELVEVEGLLERASPVDHEKDISIAELLPRQTVAVPLEARTRSSVVRSMVKLAAGTGWLWDPDKMIQAVLSREQMHPTALDNGVALLHPRRPMASILGQAFLALGRTVTGIPFGGSNGALTDVYFLICSIDDRSHLRVLARLSRLITSPGFLDAIRQASDAAAICQLIVETEADLSQ